EEFETSGQNADGLRVDWTGEDHDYPGPEVPDLTEAVKAKADGREAAEWRLWRTGDSRPGILHSLHCAGTGTGTGTGTALGTGNAVSSKQAIGVIDKYCQVIIAALLCVAVEWVVSLLLRGKKNQHNRPRAAGGRCKRSECVGAGRELPGSYAVKNVPIQSYSARLYDEPGTMFNTT
ncbi:uncharacterized protein CLUP02_03264, partial [Colletotrichum lupini]